MGEWQEGGELYPWAARVGLGVAGGDSPAWSRAGGRWRTSAVPLRRGREGKVWPQSFTAARRTHSGVQFGPRKGGEQGSTVELGRRRQWWGGGSLGARAGARLGFYRWQGGGGRVGKGRGEL